MRTISEQELKDILDSHGKWLKNDNCGKRANLSYANISNANLSDVNLSYANLSNADLRYVNLSNADLRNANLSNADLRYVNLRDVDLSFANLSNADLRNANLSFAILSFTNLSNVGLCYANLSDAEGFEFKPIQIINTRFFVTILDDRVEWGCRKFSFDELAKFTLADCEYKWDEKEFEQNKKIILDMISFYRAKVTNE